MLVLGKVGSEMSPMHHQEGIVGVQSWGDAVRETRHESCVFSPLHCPGGFTHRRRALRGRPDGGSDGTHHAKVVVDQPAAVDCIYSNVPWVRVCDGVCRQGAGIRQRSAHK